MSVISKGLSCDVPVCKDSFTFDALSDHSEILSDSNDDDTSIDNNSYENIKYVEASTLNLEYDSLEEENEDQEEKEFDSRMIYFQIQGRSLRDKLSNVYLLISKIEALNDNPTLSSFSDNSFSDHTEETRSGSTTTHANNSLPRREVRLMLKLTIPSHLSLGLFSRFSPTLRFLLYFPPPEMRIPFMTPASSLRAGGISSGWNFHML
ncbi:hypothetical protein Tco_0424695 [Tanacetum coccineum]